MGGTEGVGGGGVKSYDVSGDKKRSFRIMFFFLACVTEKKKKKTVQILTVITVNDKNIRLPYPLFISHIFFSQR